MKITVINGQNLDRVKQFCYLGSLVTKDCKSCHELRKKLLWEKRLSTRKVTSYKDPSAFT